MKMVEVKTAELIGPALDYAVAQVDGVQTHKFRDKTYALFGSIAIPLGDADEGYAPSTCWHCGGPLIEKYKLRLVPCDAGYFSYTDYMAFEGVGETALIAACRAIVYHKIGDVVSVPAELVNGGGL